MTGLTEPVHNTLRLTMIIVLIVAERARKCNKKEVGFWHTSNVYRVQTQNQQKERSSQVLFWIFWIVWGHANGGCLLFDSINEKATVELAAASSTNWYKIVHAGVWEPHLMLFSEELYECHQSPDTKPEMRCDFGFCDCVST